MAAASSAIISNPVTDQGDTGKPRDIGRRPVEKLSKDELQGLDGYFVRVKYNDRIMVIPGCQVQGNHLDGDQSLCTLGSLIPITPIVQTHVYAHKQDAFPSKKISSLMID